VQPPVLDEQTVPTGDTTVREQHALGIRALHCQRRGDGIGAPTNVDRHRFRNIGGIRVVDVLRPRFTGFGADCVEDLDGCAVIEWQTLVDTGVVEPQILELLQFVRMLLGEVV